MKTFNKYVSWMIFHGDRTAKSQGFAESQEEFEKLCAQAGYDLSEGDEIECAKVNVMDMLGKSLKKEVRGW